MFTKKGLIYLFSVCFFIIGSMLIFKSYFQVHMGWVYLILFLSPYLGLPLAFIHNAQIDKENEIKFGKEKALQMKRDYDRIDRELDHVRSFPNLGDFINSFK